MRTKFKKPFSSNSVTITSILCLLLFFVSTNQIHAQKLDWWLDLQKIKPLISTREDVDKIFSRYDKKHFTGADGSENYEVKRSDLSVKFSDGICRGDDWRVPNGVVYYSTIFFNDKTRLKFKDFVAKYQIDLKKFNRTTLSFSYSPKNTMIYYEHPDGSIQFDTVNDVYLYGVHIGAPKDYEYPRCNDVVDSRQN